MTLLLSPVVVKLPNARGVSRERLGGGEPNRIIFAPESARSSERGYS